MQNKIQSAASISYKGSIKISLLKNKKVVKSSKKHNAGTVSLVNFLNNCLAGKYHDDKRPFYIKLFKSDTEDPTKLIAITNLISFSQITQSGSVPTFSFYIPYAAAINDGGALHSAAIYTKDSTQELAKITLSQVSDQYADYSLDPMLTTYALLIQWTMQVGIGTAQAPAQEETLVQ